MLAGKSIYFENIRKEGRKEYSPDRISINVFRYFYLGIII